MAHESPTPEVRPGKAVLARIMDAATGLTLAVALVAVDVTVKTFKSEASQTAVGYCCRAGAVVLVALVVSPPLWVFPAVVSMLALVAVYIAARNPSIISAKLRRVALGLSRFARQLGQSEIRMKPSILRLTVQVGAPLTMVIHTQLDSEGGSAHINEWRSSLTVDGFEHKGEFKGEDVVSVPSLSRPISILLDIEFWFPKEA